MPNTFTKIATIVGSGTGGVLFSSIPQTYTDLVVKYSSRSNAAGPVEGMYFYFNGVTSGTQYSLTALFNGSSTYGSYRSSNGGIAGTGTGNASGWTANLFSNIEAYIPNYSNTTTFKSWYSESVAEDNTVAGGTTRIFAGLSRSTSAITSLGISNDSGGTYGSNSTFTLYGVKNT